MEEVILVVVVDVRNSKFLIRKVVVKYKVLKFIISDWFIGKVIEGSKWGSKLVLSGIDEN